MKALVYLMTVTSVLASVSAFASGGPASMDCYFQNNKGKQVHLSYDPGVRRPEKTFYFSEKAAAGQDSEQTIGFLNASEGKTTYLSQYGRSGWVLKMHYSDGKNYLDVDMDSAPVGKKAEQATYEYTGKITVRLPSPMTDTNWGQQVTFGTGGTFEGRCNYSPAS